MKYQLQKSGKPADYLLPEEQQVCEALKAFTFDPERTSVNDFTPTRMLFDAYLRFISQTGNGPDAPEVLNPKQFGAALRRAFNLSGDRHTRRRIEGRLTMGYLHVRGPGSVIAHFGPGNPNLMRRTPVAMFHPGHEPRLAC